MRCRSRGALRPSCGSRLALLSGFSGHLGSPEGEQSADRRWCGTPHPWLVSRSSRSPDRRRSPAGYAHRRASRRSAAAFSLRRRAALSAALVAPPSASSWQEAIVPPGGAPPPPGCRLRAGSAGAAPAKVRNCRAPATEGPRLFSGAAFNSSRLTTPHEAPLGRTRYEEHIGYGLKVKPRNIFFQAALRPHVARSRRLLCYCRPRPIRCADQCPAISTADLPAETGARRLRNSFFAQPIDVGCRRARLATRSNH